MRTQPFLEGLWTFGSQCNEPWGVWTSSLTAIIVAMMTVIRACWVYECRPMHVHTAVHVWRSGDTLGIRFLLPQWVQELGHQASVLSASVWGAVWPAPGQCTWLSTVLIIFIKTQGKARHHFSSLAQARDFAYFVFSHGPCRLVSFVGRHLAFRGQYLYDP